MNKASEALISIAAIGVAVDTAQENVMESMKTLGHKCDVMQEYHLNVGSADEVIQEFLTNRDEIITEYENEGPKKIYKKLLGGCNWVIPHFKKLYEGMEKETINHATVDAWGGNWLSIWFGNRRDGVIPAQGTYDFEMMKDLIKKSDKKATRDAFSEEDREILKNLADAMDNWRRATKYDRADRKFFDKFIAYSRDTRTMTCIKNATKKALDALEATRDMAKSHFGGDEPVQEGYGDYFASYHGSYSPSSGDKDAGNGLLIKTKSAARPSSSAGSPKPKSDKAADLRRAMKWDEESLAKLEKELKKAEAGEKTQMSSGQLKSHIKDTKGRLEKKKAMLAALEGGNK